MEDQNIPEQNHYFGARIYGCLMEYAGIVSGVSAGVSAFHANGFDLREAGLIFGGALLYTMGKIANSFADKPNQTDELPRMGLEEKLKNPEQ
jgi:hypothetical protein